MAAAGLLGPDLVPVILGEENKACDCHSYKGSNHKPVRDGVKDSHDEVSMNEIFSCSTIDVDPSVVIGVREIDKFGPFIVDAPIIY